jgi:REP element-mobilizing transposase RayT
MPQSLARVVVHAVFATKRRAASIGPEVRNRLHAYLGALIREAGCVPIQVGGTADHVHALFALARTRSIADAIEMMKARSSRWMKEQGAAGFGWQAGYGVFSVGERDVAVVVRYIEQQERHHERVSFADELRRLLAEHGVAYDERYLWD